MGFKQYTWIGVLILIGMMLAGFLNSLLIAPLLFMVVPTTGVFAWVSLIISWVLMAFVTGFIIVWLLKKLG